MLRVLIGSQPVRAGWLGGTTVSTVTHGALIALAVVSSVTPRTMVSESRAALPQRITYVKTVPRPAAAPRAKAAESETRAATAPVQPAPPDVVAIRDALGAELPMPDMAAPDLTAVTGAWLTQPDSLDGAASSVAEIVMAKAGLTKPENGVFTEEMVERSVEARRGNPKPRYPEVLAQMGIGGDFVVRFVVDSAGVVDDHLIEFPQAMHRLFVDAVRSALRKSRYLPAMFAGRAVPQLVVQEFRFKAAEGR
jgi:TonB family protein